ncbi:MAG: pentapeptide repeat-containing protein [Deltaproteobacteria bacterium]|jgi:uncharacterized protein YjbI with pentapeptide repeats|nr:pentapeptide repeat-containing protein [Deltaproteobacteria bacterium]
MKKILPNSLFLTGQNYLHRGLDRLALTFALGLSLRDGSVLDPASVYASAVLSLLPYQAQGLSLDSGISKKQGEFLCACSAYPVSSNASAQPVHVSLKVGTLARDFLVIGEKYEKQGPLSFNEMPLSWGKTFYDEALNPYGIKPGETAGPMGTLTSPQVFEFRPDSDGGQGQVADGPASPLPCPRTTAGLKNLGTFDDEWQNKYWPGFPPDFDYGFFNLAQKAQILGSGFFRGDERLYLKNVRPEGGVLSAALPGLRLRIMLRRSDNKDYKVSEVAPNLDTVWLFPAFESALIFWHASVKAADQKASDIETLLAVLEPLDSKPESADILLARAIAVKAEEAPLMPPPPLESEAPKSPPAPEAKSSVAVRPQDSKLPEPPKLAPPPAMAQVGRKAQDILAESWPEISSALAAGGLSDLQMSDVAARIEKNTQDMTRIEKMAAGVNPSEAGVQEHLISQGFSPQTASDLQKAASLPLPDQTAFETQADFFEAVDRYGQELAALIGVSPQAGSELAQKIKFLFSGDPAKQLQAFLTPSQLEALANPPAFDWAALGLSPDNGEQVLAALEKLDASSEITKDLSWAEKNAHLASLGPELDAAMGLFPGTMAGKFQKNSQDIKKIAWSDDDLGRALDTLALDPEHQELAAALPQIHTLRKAPPADVNSLKDIALMAGLSNPKILAVIGTLDILNPQPLDIKSSPPKPPEPKEPEQTAGPKPEDKDAEAKDPAVFTDRQEVEKYLADSWASFEGKALAGLDLKDLNLAGRNFKGADLRMSDLSGAGLAGADFSGAVLEGVKLDRSNLTGANLTSAILTGAVFGSAKVAGINLTGADLSGADMQALDLSGLKAPGAVLAKTLVSGRFKGAVLTGALFRDMSLEKADFSGAELAGAGFTKVILKGANLSGAKLDQAYMEESNLAGADLTRVQGINLRILACQLAGADLSLSDLNDFLLFNSQAKGAKFIGVKASKADLGGADLSGTNFSGAVLKETGLFGASLKGARLVRADLFKAVLGGADLSGADFTGASLYAADLFRTTIDKYTLFSQADLNMTCLKVGRTV